MGDVRPTEVGEIAIRITGLAKEKDVRGIVV